MKKNERIEKICQGLLELLIPRVKAYVNLVMAACSCLATKSVRFRSGRV